MSRGEFAFYIAWGIICVGIFPAFPFILRNHEALLDVIFFSFLFFGEFSILSTILTLFFPSFVGNTAIDLRDTIVNFGITWYTYACEIH